MTFAVGDKVVYPHHGAAIIEGKEKRVFDGQKTDYFVLRITYGDLKVSIPVDKADEIGLREVINDEEVEEVFAVLRKKEARMPTNWSRRFKNHVEKLKSGDIYQVAEVVRNLLVWLFEPNPPATIDTGSIRWRTCRPSSVGRAAVS